MMRIAVVLAILMMPFVLTANCLTAHAMEDDVKFCGDYQYRPLSGYKIVNRVISGAAAWVVINALPERPSQKDLDTPTIYCLTEKNERDFERRLHKKNEILIRTLAKHDLRYNIAAATCNVSDQMSIYFLSYDTDQGTCVSYDFAIVEVNEEGNEFDSVFVISPGRLDYDISFPSRSANDTEKQKRMCNRVHELVTTIKKR